jgi:hypothetical protein
VDDNGNNGNNGNGNDNAMVTGAQLSSLYQHPGETSLVGYTANEVTWSPSVRLAAAAYDSIHNVVNQSHDTRLRLHM